MKKGFKFLVLTLALFFVNAKVVNANQLYSIDITADIDSTGNAHITEVWDMNVDEGTEVYKPMGNMDNMEIKNFTVKDETGTRYSFVDWNINASLSEKAHKNGFHYDEDSHLELCWGMSSHGKHTYTVEYDVTNFVRVYDYDVIYYKFVNDSMDPAPDKISIRLNYDGNPLEMYTFGFEGTYDGDLNTAVATSDKALTGNNYAVVLMKFEKGTFESTNFISGQTYEDIYNMAFEDAKNAKFNAFMETIMAIGSFLLVALGTIFGGMGAAASIDKASYAFESGYTPKKLKDIHYFRDIPTNDILEAYFLSRAYSVINPNKYNNVLGSVILKWIRDNQIRIIENKGKKSTFDFSREYVGMDKHEAKLYKMMKAAATDGVLKVSDFTKYCSNHVTEYNKWFEEIVEDYEEAYKRLGKITMIDRKKGTFKYQKKQISSSVDELALRVAGVKKFLEDFSQIDTRESIQVHTWEYYLMYAQIFGIADKVAKQLQKLYPNIAEQSNLTYADYAMIDTFSHSVSSSASTSGSSSSGGGGCSLGGGSVGGCR